MKTRDRSNTKLKNSIKMLNLSVKFWFVFAHVKDFFEFKRERSVIVQDSNEDL